MEKKYTMQLELGKPKKIGKSFQAKYSTIMTQVDDEYDRQSLIFFCELLGFIDRDNEPVFSTSGYSSTDMFGGRSQYWSIQTRHILLSRSIEKSINDSWQHVDVTEDKIELSGIPNGIYIDWNGNLGYYLNLIIGEMNQEQVDWILKLGRDLFQEVKETYLKENPNAKLQSELKRQFLFKDNASKNLIDPDLSILSEILELEDEDAAKGALEKIKEKIKNKDSIERIKEILIHAAEFAKNKYVRRAIVEAAGYTFDQNFAKVIEIGLKDEEEFVQEAASQWAKHYWNDDVIVLLIKNCKSISDNVRWMAVSSLGEIIKSKKLKEKSKEEILKQLMKSINDSFRQVQSAAIYVLGAVEDQRLIDPFIKLLSSKDSMIRMDAAIALGNWGVVKALAPLENHLEDNFPSGEEVNVIKNAISKIKRKNLKPQKEP